MTERKLTRFLSQSADCKYLRCRLGSLRLCSAFEDREHISGMDLRRSDVLCSDANSRCVNGGVCCYANRDRVREAPRHCRTFKAEDDSKTSENVDGVNLAHVLHNSRGTDDDFSPEQTVFRWVLLLFSSFH